MKMQAAVISQHTSTANLINSYFEFSNSEFNFEFCNLIFLGSSFTKISSFLLQVLGDKNTTVGLLVYLYTYCFFRSLRHKQIIDIHSAGSSRALEKKQSKLFLSNKFLNFKLLVNELKPRTLMNSFQKFFNL